jgi:hypothetical protein
MALTAILDTDTQVAGVQAVPGVIDKTSLWTPTFPGRLIFPAEQSEKPRLLSPVDATSGRSYGIASQVIFCFFISRSLVSSGPNTTLSESVANP